MTITIQQAIDRLTASVPGAPFPDTVDTVKLGNAAQQITGIAVTFLATCAVIEQAAQSGANLIITHEPTFYNHLDAADWLSADLVYQAKRQLIEKKHLVIWRFHDYLHSLQPDPTLVGLIADLGWEANGSADQPYLCAVPPLTLLELGEWVKNKLGLKTVRVVGDLTMPCQRVAVLPGFPATWYQIGSLSIPGVDVLITGEIHEWETSEYVRDATRLGHSKGVIVTGHAASEEPGMRAVIPWLEERLPGVPVRFIPTGSPFHHL